VVAVLGGRKSLKRQIKLANALIVQQDKVIESYKSLIASQKREIEILKELRELETGKLRW
jgi:hypothetical protein